jgi:hypothetical protein
VHIHESIFNETFGLEADHPSFLFQTTPGAPDIKFFSVNQFVGFGDTIGKIGVTFGALFEAALGMCREMNIGDCISNNILYQLLIVTLIHPGEVFSHLIHTSVERFASFFWKLKFDFVLLAKMRIQRVLDYVVDTEGLFTSEARGDLAVRFVA